MSLSVLKEFRFCPSGSGGRRDPGQFLDRGKYCLDLCLRSVEAMVQAWGR